MVIRCSREDYLIVMAIFVNVTLQVDQRRQKIFYLYCVLVYQLFGKTDKAGHVILKSHFKFNIKTNTKSQFHNTNIGTQNKICIVLMNSTFFLSKERRRDLLYFIKATIFGL